jgi:hypothetical protein
MIKAMGDIGWFGMNSGADAQALAPGFAYRLQNVATRGNIVRTRPGFNTVFNAPSGQPQGITVFTPSGGLPHLVFACDGYVFASPFPFQDYFQLPNIRFSETSAIVTFQECEQTTDYDAEGVFYFLSQPRRLLIMQDGNTRAAVWDGSVDRHLDPSPSSGEATEIGKDETPVGLWMAWVADRLLVFRDNLGFASDIGNPLKFTESQYLAEARAFTFPDKVTGAVQPYAGLPLLVFTNNSTTQLRVDIRDRTTWVDTVDFQKTDYNIGCVAGRSIIRSFGQVWWYSEFGVTNLNAALQLNNDSRFRYYDNEMAYSKAKLSPTREWIAAAPFENYLLFSVPSSDLQNRHTWVLDQMQSPEGNMAWSGFWTGIRPVCWAVSTILGEQRIFALSLDGDGVNRVWEAFQEDRSDNGCPILSYVDTRQYNDGTQVNKQYLHSKLFWDEVLGTVDYAVYTGATRGPYNMVAQQRLVATQGSMGDNIDFTISDYASQSRTVRTQFIDKAGDCTVCGVESDLPDNIDVAFQHLITWSGDAGLRGIQMFYNDDPGFNEFQPDCVQDETGPNIVSPIGCGQPNVGPTVYTATLTGEDCNGDPVTVTRTSTISQKNADQVAQCALNIEQNAEVCP